LKEIRAAISEGKTLTDTVRQYPEVFPPLHVAMIQAGERAAFLEEVLRSLAGFLERFEELRSKVFGAMIYPSVLVALGVSVMIGALVFFVPKFEPLLNSAKKPLPTEILFAASIVARKYWYLMIIAMAGAVALDLHEFEKREIAEGFGEMAIENSGRRNGVAAAGDHAILPNSWHDARERCAVVAGVENREGRDGFEYFVGANCGCDGGGARWEAIVGAAGGGRIFSGPDFGDDYGCGRIE
jgi:hypothetical protein